MPTKQQFLDNLEKALRLLICDRLNADADEASRKELGSNVTEFVHQNASEYSMDELIETFTSYDVAIALFYEYQEAKRLLEKSPAPPQPSKSSSRFPDYGDIWWEPITEIGFIWVPGGSFSMGSGEWDDQSQEDERPVHEVWLDGFWIAQTPVTVTQYVNYTDTLPDHYSIPSATEGLAASGDYPVVGVSWHEATAFAHWLTKRSGQFFRLPSEAQWEYAARGGGRPEKYAGCDHAEAVAWYADNSMGRMHRVARKQSNSLGIHDMCGNVCEWCIDHYAKSAYRFHEGLNPVTQLEKDTARVIRGGSWQHGARDVRCADRGLLVADRREPDVGFRLIRMA